MLTNSTRIRTYACTHSRTHTLAMFTRTKYRMHRCYTFLQWAKSYRNGSKSYKRGYGGNAGNAVLYVRQHAFYSGKKSLHARAYVCNCEWGTLSQPNGEPNKSKVKSLRALKRNVHKLILISLNFYSSF